MSKDLVARLTICGGYLTHWRIAGPILTVFAFLSLSLNQASAQNNRTVYVSPPVTPYIVDVDLRTLPKEAPTKMVKVFKRRTTPLP